MIEEYWAEFVAETKMFEAAKLDQIAKFFFMVLGSIIFLCWKRA